VQRFPLTGLRLVQQRLAVEAMPRPKQFRLAYAGNLGTDHVLHYRVDAATGALTPISRGFVSVPTNTGSKRSSRATSHSPPTGIGCW